jgi:hypothetical protein
MKANEHSFSIVTAAEQDQDGVSQALVGIEGVKAVVREGKMHFDFVRYSESLDDAVSAALDEVTKRGFKVIRIDT